MSRPPGPRRRAARLYALILRLYPPQHRQRFGAEMLRSFEDDYHSAAEEGRAGVTWWFSTLSDEFRNILSEQCDRLSARMLMSIVLFGLVAFAVVALLHPKHVPILLLAALALPPAMAGVALVLLVALVLTRWLGIWRALTVIALTCATCASLGAWSAVRAGTHSTWCSSTHRTRSAPPASLVTAADFLAVGDYDYDRGRCDLAIAEYSQAIALDPGFAEAYNNRAYTYMMKQSYRQALADLNQAIRLRPDYAHALMNRGDIYNYDLINRPLAIADYERLIALGPTATSDTQVCGHLFYAVHDGWHLKTLWDLPHAGCGS